MRSRRGIDSVWILALIGAFFLTSAISDVSAEAVLDEPPTLNLIAHWAFDEGQGTTAYDSSVNANHGTIRGDPAWTQGRVGGALSFNGYPSRVEVLDSQSLGSFASQFSFCAWIKGSTLSDPWETILHRNRSDMSWFDWIVFARAEDAGLANAPVLRFDWDGDRIVDPDEEVAGNAVLAPGIWYHLAGTYDGAALKFYIDGTLTGTTPKANASIHNSPRPVWIAATSGTYGSFDYFKGIIDEVLLYNRALSAEEIWDLAHPGVTPGEVCEGFETGYTLGAELRVHPDWFYEDANSGPQPLAGTGVAGSIGLSNGTTAFAWVAHEFQWNDPTLVSYLVQMDYQTNALGVFDDDRLGWTISDTDDSSDWHLGVQMDPGGGGAGGNIECYWDGNTFGDDGGRASIVDLPALTGNSWYRMRAAFTKLSATSCKIDVTLTALDAAGNETGVVVTGTLPDTDLLPNTTGQEIPNPGYFTAASMWPLFKNYSGADGACDNACFQVVYAGSEQYTLTVNTVGSGSVVLDPPGGVYDAATEVELTAQADPGWVFAGWSGGLSGSANPKTIIMTTDLSVTSTFVEYAPVCEDFETGYTLGAELRVHPDWFYEDANSGPQPLAGAGVAGSIGLSDGATAFAWVAHEFSWSSPTLVSYIVQMDYQTNALGVFDDDRLGWTISDTDDSSDWHFGVQMDPGGGGAGGNIECYWDGNTFGDDGGRASIVDLPALTGNSWYRLRAAFTKLSATSCKIDVTLTALDAGGNEAGVVVTGTLPDTDLLPNTTGQEIPNPGYFTAASMWPLFKNYSGADGACDNACFQVVRMSAEQCALTVNTVGGGSVVLDPPGGVYDAATEVELTAQADPGWVFAGWSGGLSGFANPKTVIMTADLSVTATFVTEVALSPGDVIISGFQAWNNPGTQDPGEFVELFNTTGTPISLETLGITTRLDNDSDGLVEVEWQLSADLTGKIIAPFSFFLIAESAVAAAGGIHDVETDMDLATGEGGSTERAISIDVVIDGLHMDYVLYGRHDGSDPAGELPPGDISFDGASWPRTEVIRNTQANTSFMEGLVRRQEVADLFAGHAVEGFYTDEDALGSGFPNGVWYSPHDEQYDAYEARNSTSPPVLPGGDFPPDPPTILAPQDGLTGVPVDPELRVNVTDPDLDRLDVAFYGRATPAPSEANFSLIILPDTQKYSASYPSIYLAQTQWIVDNLAARNIVFVANEGDIVDNADQQYQWTNADAAMDLLENPVTTGLPQGIPFAMLPGNHDQPTSFFNTYFGVARFAGRSYYGGHYSTDNDNNYSLFEARGMDFILISLEYEPGSSVIAWADGLLQTHSDRRGIVVTHCLLATNGTWLGPGQEIYDTLKDNPNLFMILGGHMHGEALRTDEYQGRQVYSLLADYQDLPSGGDGWLRIMEFQPASDRIRVLTYSPTLDQYGTDTVMGDDTKSQEFFLPYDMDDRGDFSVIGEVDVQSGSDAFLDWPGRSTLTEYDWYVEISDGLHSVLGQVSSFTTAGSSTDISGTPAELAMQRSFPSPFSSQTTVQFTLPVAGRSEVLVLDLSGRRVAMLADREFPAGRHALTWDGRDGTGRQVGAGTYFVMVRSAGSTLASKVTLIR
jgi:hypothetical protein